ncbi:MAG: type IV pilus secretin PilQ [Myxococcota bacterium]
MKMRRKLSIAALAIALTASAPALAQQERGASISSKNRVSTLEVKEGADGTYVRVQGTRTPTFSVFKLSDPPRLFVDIADSAMAEEASSQAVQNGVVEKVALVGVTDSGQSLTRVIIGFSQNAFYDVRAEGSDVVIFIDGAQRRAPDDRPKAAGDDARVNEAIRTLGKTRKRLEATEEELKTLRARLKRAEGAERKAITAEISSKNAEVADARRERDVARERVRDLKEERKRAIARAEAAEKRARDGEVQVQKAERLAAAQAKLAKEHQARAVVADQRAEQAERLAQVRAKEAKKASSRAASLDQDLDRALEEKKTLARSLEDTRSRALRTQSTLERKNNELNKTRERAASLERQLADMRTRASTGDLAASKQLTQLERERKALAGDLTKSTNELARVKQRSDAAQANLERAQRDLAQRDEEVRAMRAQLAKLRTETAAAQKAAASRVASAPKERPAGPAARAVPVDPMAPNMVRDIKLETINGRSRIVVELDRPGDLETLPGRQSRAVMILNNTELPDALERTLNARAQGGAVRFVSSFADKEHVRMEAELHGATAETVRKEGRKIIWEFAPVAPQKASAPPSAASSVARADAALAPRPTDVGGAFTSAPPMIVTDPTKVSRVPGLSRKRLTIDLRDADVQNVLRLIAREGGVNIIAGDDVSGNITIRLRSVPLEQVFLTVLQARSLGFELRGNVIRVAPQDVLLDEERVRAEAAELRQRNKPLEVFLLPVNYAAAAQLIPQVQGLLSQRGTVNVDQRTNTLIIKDISQNLQSIRTLVETLDSQVPQVLIEARIVETNDTFTKQIGIQWGGDFALSQRNGNPTGLLFPSVLGVAGGATDGQSPVAGLQIQDSPNYAVNLPAPIGTGAGGGIGLNLGSVGGGVNLNIRLSALEVSGSARIVSAPKVMTLNNTTATISQGTSIPISVVSAAGVQTVFVDATLELRVTPQVTPDGNIRLRINATKNEPDFQNTGARGDPSIIRRQAETELLIKDGDTTVIGGIYTRNAGENLNAVPFFHRIPVIGFFFRTSTEREQRQELLIFITPKIVNRAEALGSTSAGTVDAAPRAAPAPAP